MLFYRFYAIIHLKVGDMMVNILLEGYDLDAKWLYEDLKTYIKPEYKVAVVAFSFRDNRVKNASDWAALYSKENGRFYGGIVGAFCSYGIKQENITFLNYFEDTSEEAKNKIQQADIVYFLGGLPDRMMDRINDLGLFKVLKNHKNITIGYSAGAVVQLGEYYLSPDADYSEFKYYKGIPYINDFYFQPHYEGNENQITSINRIFNERKKPVYATHTGKGAVVVIDGKVKTIGEVSAFEP